MKKIKKDSIDHQMRGENMKKETKPVTIDVSEEVGKLIQYREEFFNSIASSLRHIHEDMGKLKEVDNKIIVSLTQKKVDK
jgi:hypothetical protein